MISDENEDHEFTLKKCLIVILWILNILNRRKNEKSTLKRYLCLLDFSIFITHINDVRSRLIQSDSTEIFELYACLIIRFSHLPNSTQSLLLIDHTGFLIFICHALDSFFNIHKLSRYHVLFYIELISFLNHLRRFD